MMTKEQLEGIKQRCDAATPGPWQICGGGPPWFSVDSPDMTIAQDCAEEDAEFIAHAREDVPTLVAEVEKWREWTRMLYSDKVGEPNLDQLQAIREALGEE